MDEKSPRDEAELRESGACWAIPGVVLAALLALLAFVSPFTSSESAVAETRSMAAR